MFDYRMYHLFKRFRGRVTYTSNKNRDRKEND